MIYVLAFVAGVLGSTVGAYAWARWGWIGLKPTGSAECIEIRADTSQAIREIDRLRVSIAELQLAMEINRIQPESNQ